MNLVIQDQIQEYLDTTFRLNRTVNVQYVGNLFVIKENNQQRTLRPIEFERELQNLKQKVLEKQNGSNHLPFAFLIWWTIHQNRYDVAELNEKAEDVNLPACIQKRLTGDKEKSAWLKSTQIGAYGLESNSTHSGLKVLYQTKDIKRGEWRAILAEFIDQHDKKVKVEQVALLGWENNYITADVSEVDGIDFDEVVELITDMQENMDDRVGKIDDAKIRNAILNWLELKHRVCVRGTGGVYLLPVHPRNMEQVKEEALAVRNWITETNAGTFSIVELTSGGATTIEDFRRTAIEEIENELNTIHETINTYNPDISEGKLAYSVGTQVKKLQRLGEKIKAVNSSLGDVIDRVDAQYQVILSEAKQLHQDAVISSQTQSLKTKQEKRKEDAREKSRKAGSVFDRRKQKV